MANAAELQAEFLATMLATAPKGDDLTWLIEQALPRSQGNPGLASDVLSALQRNEASASERADALLKVSDGSPAHEAEALELIALEPSLTQKLNNLLPREIAHAAPARREHDLRRRGVQARADPRGWPAV